MVFKPRLLLLAVSVLLPCAMAQPQFTSPQYNAILNEEEPLGTEVTTVGAFYFDSFGRVLTDGEFSLSSEGDGQHFTIESVPTLTLTSGIVRTATVFDRDVENAQTVFEFVLTYTIPDGSQSATALVRVSLDDVNDNAPRFTERIFNAPVFEETPGGRAVFNVTAVDPDLLLITQTIDETGENFGEPEYTVDNGRIIYSIIAGNDLGHFSINSDNGTLFLSPDTTLDVDLIDLYNLTLMAVDGGGLNDTATVLVHVLDSNDNQPVILSPLAVEVTIPEDIQTGYVIVESINATDADRGLNAEIRFLVTGGDITNSFTIDEISGEIVVSAPLDREVSATLVLTVVARDQGIIPLQDTIDVVINLLDINDYTPTFLQTSYEATVEENSNPNTRVTRVEAIDLDMGPNGTVTYSLLGETNETFVIDPQTGEILTNRSFDREEISSYALEIEAVDNPENLTYQLSSIVDVTVLIGDINDNSPIFEQDSYEVSILDTVRRNTNIIQLIAIDLDTGSNGEVSYRIEVPDSTDPNAFQIRETTGFVYVNRQLRFENQSVYTYTIRALDNSGFRLTTDVQLTIYIHNLNENPPIFEEEEYNTTIFETTPVGQVVLNVTANDPDEGPIGEVRYRILTQFDSAGSFGVNETTGDVFVNSTLDFDFRGIIFFQIEAYDGGFPEPFTGVTNVTILLTGENDEAPTIEFPEGFRILVTEHEPPEIELVVLSLYTSDPDFGSGGEFDFAIADIFDSLSENDSFAINETTGLITSLRVFDRELQPDGIVVAIETADFGNPPQSQVTNITIFIGDINDNAPFFESNVSTIAYEFLPPGVEVLPEYRALDDDIDQNAQLEYGIFAGDEFGRFSIDPQTGGIFTAQVLNKTVQDMYNLTIMAVDQGSPQMYGFGQIFIEVLDANDNVPTFSEPVYEVAFPENTTFGTTILQVNASDSDVGTNAVIQYFLAPNSSHTERFAVNSSTGEIYTTDVFDRESDALFELTVIAVDDGEVPLTLTGSATVRITLEDLNDNAPQFNETSYEASVVENELAGTLVVSVLAFDLDGEEPNNVIRYSLSRNRSEAFRVDPVSGDVYVNGEVDWEEGADFTIIVMAADLGDPPRSAEAEIRIFIEDINDNFPTFILESLNLSIPENSEIGTEVGFVDTVDPDSIGNNSLVSYSIVLDFAGDRFELDEETGLVTFVSGTLNREVRPTFDLLIQAVDHGSPQLRTDAILIITILDSNDFDPVFDQNLYNSSVLENSPTGTSILTVRATDRDAGVNADLRYSIPDPFYSQYFSVNETTGTISVIENNEFFDFENITLVTFEVLVTDSGIQPRNDSTTVEIEIVDSNDHPPVFEQDEYSAVLRENLASGTTVLRVNTSDVDTGSNAIVEYSLKPGLGSEDFGIHPQTGVLYTVRYLNREEFLYYNLTIIANNSVAPIPLFSEVQANVSLTDLNDMHPSFDPITEVFVPENATVDSIIHSLMPADGDEGPNGTVTYSLQIGNEDGEFRLDSDTGDIVLLQELDFESRSQYVFTVLANDSGTPSLGNYTNVLVRVTDVNDLIPSFTSPGYTVTVNSEVDVGTVIATLVAFDGDQGSNAKLTYAITVDDSPGLFSLASSEEGRLRTVSSLSSHAGQNFTLVVRASDPDHNTTAPITIFIQGGDASLPYFVQQSFSVSIPEDTSGGENIFEFSSQAVNEDSYDIINGNENDVFSITGSGTVRLESSALDFETQSRHQLSISIANSVGNRAYAILDIVVTDVNEYAPVFISDSFFAVVSETLPTAVPFFSLIATDRDGSFPANDITYEITSSDLFVLNTFLIDSQTGELSLRRDVTYQFGDQNFTLAAVATNEATSPQLSTEATINIIVLRANKNQPYFSPVNYALSLFENETVGLNIVNVSAFDDDVGSQGEITYGMHGDHRYLDFRIDTFSGSIFTNYPLDYERHNLYTLEIVASDGGNPNRFATAAVLVQILDLNDNTPVWEQTQYFASLVENITEGSTVISVRATDEDQVDQTTDPDTGEIVFFTRNGYVTYSISSGDPENQFSIDPDTGVVTIASTLDREVFPEYNLTLNATDGPGLFANAYLHIVIHDVNDQIPQFSESPYQVGIPEDAENGTFVIQVAAVDTDLNQNSNFTFELAGGNVDNTFALDSISGEIFLETSLNREAIESFALIVEAIDMGTVPLTSTVGVEITVLDINEFRPVFSADNYTGEVFENEPFGTPILQVSASDMDFEENATVQFMIISGNEAGRFDINSSSGVISVAAFINFEQQEEYDLVVMATDSGPISERLSSDVNVTVLILDRNDNPPIFSEDSYSVVISESLLSGSEVILFEVSDADSGVNSQIMFSLDFQSDSEAETIFFIDPLTGIINLTENVDLDRERTQSYDVIVFAMDQGDPPMQASVPVTIVIADFNDNNPQFTQAFFEGALFENLPPGTPAAVVSATDEDINENAELEFEITGIIDNEEECVSSCSGAAFCQGAFNQANYSNLFPFYITTNNLTGEIFSSQPLDRENISDYILLVQATDSPLNATRLSSSVCVHVSVLDQNDEIPLFNQTLYMASISEFTGDGSFVVQVFASDDDISTNADITFQLLSESGSFTVHPARGEIFTVGEYDREARDVYNITIAARDGGEFPLEGTAVVMVTILDENDNQPEFSNSLFLAFIEENMPPNSPVIQLNTTDVDINENAEITYSVDSITPENHFEINPTMGQLYTVQFLDRENISQYVITVLATDSGIPSLFTSTQVNVSVLDTNDLAPVFAETPYVVQIEENSLQNGAIFMVRADDGDIATNAEIFFTLAGIEPEISSAFEMDETSGELLLTQPLNAEDSLSYSLTVVANNGPALPEQQSEVTITVAVIDQNDNQPQFEQEDYVTTITEARGNGSVVIQLEAFDSDVTDTNSRLTFAITGGFNTSLFVIEPTSGIITVEAPLDRESEPIHILEVTVFDSGVPIMSSITTVTVILQDFNDNVPVFEQSTYAFTIVENQPELTSVGRVSAIDIDLQVISYYLLENITDGTFFSVNSTTGELFSEAALDREIQEVYAFIVVATDNGVNLERTAEVSVNVTVLDQNDVPPAFLLPLYNVSWLENTTIGTSLLSVEAFDPDLGENSTLAYSINPSNDSTFFSINMTTGEIFLERQFDREEQDFFQFEVAVCDFGSPRLTGSVTVELQVLDNNDNIPVLNASEYQATLDEDTPVGSTVTYIGASDEDIDENAEIRYSLSNDFDGTFSIGPASRIVVLTKSLDYEFAQSYSFFVIARDSAQEPLSSSSSVFIEVVDLNDNPPVFDFPLYQVSISENAILDAPVFRIPATDSDSTSNGELRYTILSGNFELRFAVDEVAGVISVANYLNREITPFYSLSLQVVDLGTPQFTANTELEITVTDVNDHPPEFDSKTYSILISELTEIGTSVFTFEPRDLDIGQNANFSFTIVSGNADAAFDVDSLLGSVMVARNLDFETTPAYSLSVSVTDNGYPTPFSDITNLRISLMDQNEHPPVFAESEYLVDVSQNAVIGTPIGFFIATDADLYSQTQIIYSLENITDDVPFSLDPLSGTLYVRTQLYPTNYTLILEASDGPYTTQAEISIRVIAEPSTIPLFLSPAYLFQVSEATGINVVIGQLDSSLSSATISSAFSAAIGELFQVSLSGELILIGQLDRGTVPAYVFNVQSESEMGEFAFAIVTIEVMDQNDIVPVFESTLYSVSLSELTPIGTTILTLRAFDRDPPGENSDFEITISHGNEGGIFVLELPTGSLVTSRTLDFETQSVFTLTANVTNNLVSPKLFSTAEISIEVFDVNDNNPEFSQIFYQVQIPESTPFGRDILILEATDSDFGTNSELVFSITNLNIPYSFTINQTYGSISTNTTFDVGDTSTSYIISAMVADRGNPQPRSDVTTIFVEVTPDNDFSPEFSQPDGFSAEIPDTLPIGGSVLQITATDPDSDLPLPLSYSIQAGDPRANFEINPSTGLILLASNLDFPEQSFYSLTVEAVDFGTPPRSSQVTVNISVIDINNHDPQFDQVGYEGAVFENVTIGTSILQVFASDPDSASLTYMLTVNAIQNGNQLFALNFSTGELSTTAAIDRELADNLELLVTAIDSGYPIQRSQSVPVIVSVLDLNDNPPLFDQSVITIPVLRFLPPGRFVATVTASDADLVSQQLVYTIAEDNSGGLFYINSTSGEITTISRVPEFTSPDVLIATPDAFELTLAAFDGAFTTEVLLRMELVAQGEFCENGFCTRIRPVNCTFDIFPFIECNPFCIADYALSPERRACLQFYCLNSTLVPCTTTRTCVLQNEACAGVCPEAMSVCPTTNLCHFLTLSESCDGSGENCLIGQTLVQRADSSRYCISSEVLPTNGLTCISEGEVYCEALDECSNLTVPLLCQACPTGLQECADTRECVSDLDRCCGFSGYFCDVLDQCLALGERCELPNVAPVIQSSLIYLESILSFDPSDVFSSSGHVIGLLLSNSASPAVDTQGEEVGIAVVEVSSIPLLYGEWQYALCSDTLVDSYGACSNITSAWFPIADVSEMNALVLTNSARVRFVRRRVEFSGAVWMRAKLWDGNQDGFLSASRDIIRFSEPHYNSSLPFSGTGAYSENTTLITILVHPLLEPPRFSNQATFQFSSIEENPVFVMNHGGTIADLVTSVSTPNFAILSEDTIEGFPSGAVSFEQLLEPSVSESYYAQVQRVNPTRRERQLAQDLNQDFGVGVSFDPDEKSDGEWQISLDGDARTFVYLDSVISTNDQIVLLNTSARLRFLPNGDFCGSTASSILIRPWDGFWNDSVATLLESSYIVTPGNEPNASLSQYNLNEAQKVVIDVVCVADKPVVLMSQAQLDPIPYRITHRYERLFTVLVTREISSLREERERVIDFLELTLRNEVDHRRLYPATENSTYISFSVADDVLSFGEVQGLIVERGEILAELGYEIIDISQDASYGSGSGCDSDEPTRHHGTQVNALVSRFATDSDGDYLGMAVVGVRSSLQYGVWQYYRGNWSRMDTAFDSDSSIWINFPPNISETSAFLLHGSDRLRFLPRPSFYWKNSSSEADMPPAFQVKIWDNSFQSFIVTPMSEVSVTNINTNPFVDTLQSLTNPIGLFSDDIVTIEASRYGCDGIVNSGLVHDACCICGGNGSSCVGCDTQIDSNAVYDACDVCSGDDTTCLGCDFIPFSGVEPGPCGECISDVLIAGVDTLELLYPPSSFVDCNGVCYGTSLLDECSVCSGGETLHGYNSDIDCAGMCFGAATIDDCGDCTGPGTALYFNQNMDCTGVCGGPFVADSCGICQLPNDDGLVLENRDCAGICFGDAQLDRCDVCYGGSTNVSANSTIDACGVCDGDNTSCFGCDGVVNSGRTVDRCGTCGGNNCGCFQIDFITPERGPRTGGTEITIYGAGFFLNDSSTLGYTFEPESVNCGAPLRFPLGESIGIACRFLTANNEQQLRGFSTPVSQSSIRCITESTVDFPMYIPEFFIQLQVEDGPLSNLITFYYDDYSVIEISDIVPQDAEILREATLSFMGENFINASVAACLVYDLEACGSSFSSTENPLAIPAYYHNSSAMSCTMPSVELPCRVTAMLSLDGQVSGILQSSAIDFTYRFTAPEVQSIHFSDDLSSLIIRFDRQAELVSDISLTCEIIFRYESYVLLGASAANCYWTNDLQEEITIRLPRNATVRVSSPITFRDGIILTQGQLYSYAVSSLTVYYVDTELNAIPPIAVLNGPTSIPSCGMADFTAIYSLYPGYGSFEYQWSVFVVNSSISNFSNIVQYLNDLSTESASISLDSSLFLPEVEYYLELHVINSIGVRSEPVTILLLKDADPFLQLFLVGSSIREIFPGEDLLVESHVTAPECHEQIGNAEYNWQLFRITDARQLLLMEEDLSSVPTESSDIFIDAEYFTQNTTYILRLTVSADGGTAVSTNTTVTILPLSIQAVIHGGNRTVSQNRTMVLDARSSILDPMLTEAAYEWSCNVVGSFEPCYNQSESFPTPIVIPKTDNVTISASHLEPGRAYNITLALTQGTQISYAFTVIQIIATRPPIVEILPIATNVVSSRQIRLEGLVYSALPTSSVNWESLRLPGQGYIDISDPSTVQSQTSYPESQDLLSLNSIEDYSSIPLEASVTQSETSRANLVLQPNTLTAGLTYTFQLTAVNSEGRGVAQVSIVADGSPHSALLSIAPQSGIALETQFLLTVSGVIDTTIDTPVLYQFGIVQETSSDPTMLPDETIHWISGIQTENSLQTLLPTREAENNFVLVRIFDRKGGYSDIVARVTVTMNQLTNENFYMTLLGDIKSTLESTKNWRVALSDLTSVLLELNNNTANVSQGIRAEALNIFLSIFNTQLPASQTHYNLAASVLALITSSGEITDSGDQIRIAEALETILNWYRRNAVSITSNPVQVPDQSNGEPMLLLTSNRASTRNAITQTSAEVLLSSWVNVLESSPTTPSVARSFVQNIESLSYILCQEMVLGEAATLIETSLANVYIRNTVPLGAFNVFGALFDFRSSLLESYRSLSCQTENVACSETCFQGARYPLDLFADRNMQIATLNSESQLAVLTEIEGSDPQSIELISDVVSAVISSPSQNRFLEVNALASPFQVLIPMRRPIPSDGSQGLCLSRAVGGSSGFERFEWQIDNITAPQTTTIDSSEYFICEFTHLSEFVVGLLPPLIVTEPPVVTTSTVTSSSVASSSSTSTSTTSVATETTPPPTDPTETPVSSGTSPVIFIAVIIIVIAIGVVVILLILCITWRKNRKKKMKVTPGDGTDRPQSREAFTQEDREREKARLTKAGLLTPEESKISMNIIQLLDNGERSQIGSMNILPSVRLRELRHELSDHFANLKNKPFYFLTRQLCDIEPAAEQQQFVSLVFGDEPNKPVFVREVATIDEQSRRHFCICNNAAVFECSNCSSQGYCSEECQLKHWGEQHQRECGRMSERKRRSEILLRRQTSSLSALSPVDERPRRLTIGSPPPLGVQKVLSPTTPTDWKSFLSSTKPSQPVIPQGADSPTRKSTVAPPLSAAKTPQARTTLAHLAQQPSIPTPGEGKMNALSPQKQATNVRPAGLQSGVKRTLPPLSRTPSVPTPSANIPSFSGPGFSSQTYGSLHESPAQQPIQQSSQVSAQAFFSHTRQARVPNYPGMRRISIQSVTSDDLNQSKPFSSRDVRNEPLLESDEDDYESTETESETRTPTPNTKTQETMRSPSAQTSSRPPSLAVRKKRGSQSRTSKASSSSSSSGSGSDSEGSSSDSESQTRKPPLRRISTDSRASRSSNSRPVTSDVQQSAVETTELQPSHASVD